MKQLCLLLLALLVVFQAIPARAAGQEGKEKRKKQARKDEGGEKVYKRWLDNDVAYIITPEERAAFGRQSARSDAHVIADGRVRGRECRGQMHRGLQRLLFRASGVPVQRAGSATHQSRWVECV